VKRVLVRQALLLLALAMVPGIVQAVYYRDRVSWDAPAIAPDEVTLEQAQSWGDTVMWVDARPAEQFEREHIPAALSLNEDSWDELLPQMLAQWSPEKHVIVYCSSQSCAASHDVARRLREEAGLKNVYVLHRGWEGWLAAKK
jgi:rhodanese-related sulfurtransferase